MIHQYKLNGYNIVVDVYSGSVHAVDELAYDAIALVDAGTPRAEIPQKLLAKYRHNPEVTEAEIADCLAAFSPPMSTSPTPSTSKTAPPWSRPSACMWPTPATSTANTASRPRASSTAKPA